MKSVVGVVVSNRMHKSVVVGVDRLFQNKLYNRYVKCTSKFMAHDENDQCNISDKVKLDRCRPLSKRFFDELQLRRDFSTSYRFCALPKQPKNSQHWLCITLAVGCSLEN